MGCDIHSFAEVRKEGKWIKVEDKIFPEWGRMISEPFGWRDYGMFGFLANVRNYSEVPSLSDYRGLPEDSEWLNAPDKYAYDTNPMSGEPIPVHERETNKHYYEHCDYHSHGYLTLQELLAVDYDSQFEDRRTTETKGNVTRGDITANPGKGKMVTYREFLGESFLRHLEILKSLGEPQDVRVVFWFDC